MRQLEREKRGFWFAPYAGKTQLVDEGGRLTGEWVISYGKPRFFTATISPRSGNTWGDGFGIGVDCDRKIVIDKIGLGIEETSVLWVDSEPSVDEYGNLVLDENKEPATPFDYTIVMVAESYNFTAIAIKKAE